MEVKELLQSCIQKDPLAQRKLYNLLAPKMMAVCNRFAESREDAEDMLQEGFIRMFNQLHSYQGTGAFEGWVRRIVVHTCINILKRTKKFNDHLDLETVSEIPRNEESIASFLQGKQVYEAIKHLPYGYRTVLLLYAIEGYSHKEIATLLGINESTSRSQYTRAKAILEKTLLKEKIISSQNFKMA